MEESLQEREDILAARETEFAHTKGVTYLDHAGTTLYSSVQLQSYLSDLTSHLYGNPHSQNPSSKHSTDVIEQTREKVLNHFNTSLSHYDVIFTSGATGALKLLAESFPWTPHAHANIPELNRRSPTTEVSYLPDCKAYTGNSSNLQAAHRSELSTHSGSVFCYLEDNHTSVVGMRETAAARGARLVCTNPENMITNPELRTAANSANEGTSILSNSTSTNNGDSFQPPLHLFAFPAQSNFCGHKYPQNWTHQIPTGQLVFETLPPSPGRWLVAMDAASLVSTSPLDLSSYPANFVAISFYKMFGFPTGLGALLVRRDCCGLLRKGYYGGGTVAATLSRERFHVHRAELHERLEDGTVSFLSIAALSHGFDALTRIGRSMEDISTHTFTLAQYVYTSLAHLRHSNGRPVVTVYSHGRYTNPSQQGPIINFNVLRSDGHVVGYSEVDKLACVHDIHLRTGCFCNTGACMRYLGVSAERVKEHLKAGHVCGDSVDLVNGEPTGTVRVSLGYMSTLHDAQVLLSFMKTCFVDTLTQTEGDAPCIVPGRVPEPHLTENQEISNTDSIMLLRLGDRVEAFDKGGGLHNVGHLSHLTLYPIKSCSGQSVSSWQVGTKGLLYDREWMVVDERGVGLSLKQEVRLCHVKPVVDLVSGTLTLSASKQPPLVMELGRDSGGLGPDSGGHVSTRVCGDRVKGVDCGDEAADWLTTVLHRRCRLLRQNPQAQRLSHKPISPHNDRGTPLSLANEAQYLLVSETSIQYLCSAVHERGRHDNLEVAECITRFRPNLVVSPSVASGNGCLEPYAEEEWERVKIGGAAFNAIGGCRRCQLVCVDPSNGGRSPEPLKTLMELRGSKVIFGIYLTRNAEKFFYDN